MKLSKKQKREAVKIAIGGGLFLAGWAVSALSGLPRVYGLALYAPAYLILGLPIVVKAVKNVLHGNMLDENFLMSIASIGAFSLLECAEGVAVMLFDRVGNFFEDYALGRSRRNIADLVTLTPDYANLLQQGQVERVLPEAVTVGQTVVVLPGEKVPLDGVITSGETAFDTSGLTGESLPRSAGVGDEAISGFINLSGKIEMMVKKEYSESTVSKILALIESATDKKSRSENFITKFARVYTPIVVGLAAAICLFPTLLHAAAPGLVAEGFSIWFYRAMLFLIVSCPCALVISVPLTFFGGIGGASKRGVLIKGSNYMEVLAKADLFVFDKTGTLTEGALRVSQTEPSGVPEKELLYWAAAAEQYSTHPIAKAITAAADGPLPPAQVTEIAGKGLCASVASERILAGNGLLMEEFGVDYTPAVSENTLVYVAKGERFIGTIYVSDTLKKEAYDTVKALGRFADTVILSGDAEPVAQAVGRSLGVGKVYAGLLPQDKVNRLEALKEGHVCVFTGDGMNDAPVLAMADVGIAMGGIGSDAAIEAADIVIMDDNPAKILDARSFSRKTLRIVKQNIAFSLAVKIGVMVFGVFGAANMWQAVVADVGVMILAVINAMRAAKL